MNNLVILFLGCLSAVLTLYFSAKVVLGSLFSRNITFWALVKVIVYDTAFLASTIYLFYMLVTGKMLF
jgi:hypothetical protein